jgi:hypothetical protein
MAQYEDRLQKASLVSAPLQPHRNVFLCQKSFHVADGVGAAHSFSVGVKGKPRSPLNSFFSRRSLELLARRMTPGATAFEPVFPAGHEPKMPLLTELENLFCPRSTKMSRLRR